MMIQCPELLCSRCMRRIRSTRERCAECGYNNAVRSWEEDDLPFSVIGGRYATGVCEERGLLFRRYIAADHLGYRYTMDELFPSHLARRNPVTDAVEPRSPIFERCKQMTREACRMLMEMNGPHFRGVHEVVEENGTLYIVRPLVLGKALSAADETLERMPFGQAYARLRPVMLAVQALHENGYPNREIVIGANILSQTYSCDLVLDVDLDCLLFSEEFDDIHFIRIPDTGPIPTPPQASDAFALLGLLRHMTLGEWPLEGACFNSVREMIAALDEMDEIEAAFDNREVEWTEPVDRVPVPAFGADRVLGGRYFVSGRRQILPGFGPVYQGWDAQGTMLNIYEYDPVRSQWNLERDVTEAGTWTALCGWGRSTALRR